MVEAISTDVGPEPTKGELLPHESYLAIKDKLSNTLFQKNRARFINPFKESVQVN